METSLGLALGLVLTAGLIAGACLLLGAAFLPPQNAHRHSIFAQAGHDTIFLFDGETLLDASADARALIAETEGSADAKADPASATSAWQQMLRRLEPLFPGLTARVQNLPEEGRILLSARPDLKADLTLKAEFYGGLTQLVILDGSDGSTLARGEGVMEIALREEVAALRDICTNAPIPIWRESSEGRITWANGRYLALAAEKNALGAEVNWPLPRLFEETPPQNGKPHLQKLVLGRRSHSFEITAIPPFSLPDGREEERICYAFSADRLEAAETSRREFTQTLAKTFAQLPIGLAIFDRSRHLQMFNPALVDLTTLPVEFLISRPSLAALLDAMRDKSMLPEPRDYRSWRRQMIEMEQAAASGLFQESWSLPSGQTFCVTGRPHPEGGLAFMIEDISGEVTRTRRFRADLELGQAVIDAMEDAVAVFSQDGTLTMGNRALSDLWGADAACQSLSAPAALRAIPQWREATAPTLFWSDLETYIGQFGTREAWEGELRLGDGRPLHCRAAPLPHGSTLVTFRSLLSKTELSADASPPRAVLIA